MKFEKQAETAPRVASKPPFLCSAADWLPYGRFDPVRRYSAAQCRLRRSVVSLTAICSLPLPEHCLLCGRLDLPPLGGPTHGHSSALRACRKSLSSLCSSFRPPLVV